MAKLELIEDTGVLKVDINWVDDKWRYLFHSVRAMSADRIMQHYRGLTAVLLDPDIAKFKIDIYTLQNTLKYVAMEFCKFAATPERTNYASDPAPQAPIDEHPAYLGTVSSGQGTSGGRLAVAATVFAPVPGVY